MDNDTTKFLANQDKKQHFIDKILAHNLILKQ